MAEAIARQGFLNTTSMNGGNTLYCRYNCLFNFGLPQFTDLRVASGL